MKGRPLPARLLGVAFLLCRFLASASSGARGSPSEKACLAHVKDHCQDACGAVGNRTACFPSCKKECVGAARQCLNGQCDEEICHCHSECQVATADGQECHCHSVRETMHEMCLHACMTRAKAAGSKAKSQKRKMKECMFACMGGLVRTCGLPPPSARPPPR